MIATRDIGAAAADALLNPSVHGKQTRELLGQRDLTYTEVATIIGKAIGKPDLKYVQAPDDQFRSVLVQMGMSEQFARLLLEMIGALNSGYMRALEPRTPQNTTPTSYETFVADYIRPGLSTASRSLSGTRRGGRHSSAPGILILNIPPFRPQFTLYQRPADTSLSPITGTFVIPPSRIR